MPEDRVAVAAMELVAEVGLEGVSVRTVARRAGVSPGLVQHRFGTKQLLLMEAMEVVVGRFQARLQGLSTVASPDNALRALAEQLLPLDESRRVEARVWLAFVARAAIDPEVSARYRQAWRGMQDVFSALFASRRRAASGSAPAACDSVKDDDAAAQLLALLDGMTIAHLAEAGRMSPQRMRVLLAQALNHQ